MASSTRTAEPLIFLLDGEEECSCTNKGVHRCCTFHKVMQMVPLCFKGRACEQCYGCDDMQLNFRKNIKNKFLRARKRIPATVRDLYTREMAHYGIRVSWGKQAAMYDDVDGTEPPPIRLAPRSPKFTPITPTEALNYQQSMALQKVKASAVAHQSATTASAAKQQRVALSSLPRGSPDISEYRLAASGYYVAVNNETMKTYKFHPDRPQHSTHQQATRRRGR